MQTFDMERMNLRKLNDLEVKEWYQVKVSNSFEALENLDDEDDDDDVDINKIWESIRGNTNTSATDCLC